MFMEGQGWGHTGSGFTCIPIRFSSHIKMDISLVRSNLVLYWSRTGMCSLIMLTLQFGDILNSIAAAECLSGGDSQKWLVLALAAMENCIPFLKRQIFIWLLIPWTHPGSTIENILYVGLLLKTSWKRQCKMLYYVDWNHRLDSITPILCTVSQSYSCQIHV